MTFELNLHANARVLVMCNHDSIFLSVRSYISDVGYTFIEHIDEDDFWRGWRGSILYNLGCFSMFFMEIFTCFTF